MILVTKSNVSEELLTTIVDSSTSNLFLLQTSKGVHTAELRRSSTRKSTPYFVVKHIYNSPYAVIQKGSSCTYVAGMLSKLVDCIRCEDYDFYIRRGITMITISYEVLRGLIKEYVLINHDIKIDDTYDIDFNGTEVEICKIYVGSFKPIKVDFVVGDAIKMFNKAHKDKV